MQFLAPCGHPGEPIVGTFVLCRKCTPPKGAAAPSRILPTIKFTANVSYSFAGVTPPPLPPKPWSELTCVGTIEQHAKLARTVLGHETHLAIGLPYTPYALTAEKTLRLLFPNAGIFRQTGSSAWIKDRRSGQMLYDFGDVLAAPPAPAPAAAGVTWTFAEAVTELTLACASHSGPLQLWLPTATTDWLAIAQAVSSNVGPRVSVGHYRGREDANLLDGGNTNLLWSSPGSPGRIRISGSAPAATSQNWDEATASNVVGGFLAAYYSGNPAASLLIEMPKVGWVNSFWSNLMSRFSRIHGRFRADGYMNIVDGQGHLIKDWGIVA